MMYDEDIDYEKTCLLIQRDLYGIIRRIDSLMEDEELCYYQVKREIESYDNILFNYSDLIDDNEEGFKVFDMRMYKSINTNLDDAIAALSTITERFTVPVYNQEWRDKFFLK